MKNAPVPLPNMESFRELTPLIRAVLRQELTPRQQEVVQLLYREGLTVSRCAKRLSVSPSTVCRTRDRALLRLRRYVSYGTKVKKDLDN